MIDPYTPVLTFTLGLLAGRFSQSSYARRWWWRLKNTMPCRCQKCGAWHTREQMYYAEHHVAGKVLLCEDCHDEQYHPFTTSRTDQDS